MSKSKFIVMLSLAVFMAVPTYVSAEEGSSKVSYSAKKQGQFPFKADAQSDGAQVQNTADDQIHPADIEPAAGASDSDEAFQSDNLSDSIKLPRKH